MYGLTPFSREHLDPFSLFGSFERGLFGENTPYFRYTDIRDAGSSYIMETELPGFERDDISIDISGASLIVSAEKQVTDTDGDDSSYVRRERLRSAYRRSFDISGVNSDEITAEYKNGVLIINMPKKKRDEPVSRRLTIA